MRPEILFPLFRPLTALAGVGPRIAKAAARLDLERPLDLLWHLPSGLLDRRFSPPLDSAPDGVVATLTIEVGSHLPAANRRLPYRVMCHNESGEITLVFFHARPDYLLRVLPEGASRVVPGRPERFRGELQMSHPDHIGESAELERIQTIEPVYPLTAGPTAKALQRAMNDALAELPELPVWLDPAQQTAQTWPHWRAAVQTVHAPAEAEELEPLAPARARLAYDELLANQLALALMRRSLRRRAGRATRAEGSLRQRVVAVLDYQLTAAQARTAGEIDAGLAAHHRMLRLLQGDVGSGKTIVALLALLTAVEAGAQATLMAPTEILARQHFASLEP
jgi:ATP-dependent DNA helicase RecG